MSRTPRSAGPLLDPTGTLARVAIESGDASDCAVSTGAVPSNQVLAHYRYDASIAAQLPGGGSVGLRPVSRSGPPAIINIPGFDDLAAIKVWTMSAFRRSTVHDRILRHGADDWVGLWVVLRFVRESFPADSSDQEIREETLAVIRELLENGCVRVGRPLIDGSFAGQDGPARHLIAELDAEWQELGRDPTIGDIAWLENTERGDQAARLLGTSE